LELLTLQIFASIGTYIILLFVIVLRNWLQTEDP